MFWNRTTTSILDSWHDELAYGMESGRSPLFHAGGSHSSLHSLLSIAAARTLFAQTTAGVSPTIATSSEVAWLTLLDAKAPSRSNATVALTGADLTTHLAALNTLTLPDAIRGTARIEGPSSGLDLQMGWLFAPQSVPAAVPPWASIPFALEPLSEPDSLPPAEALRYELTSARPQQDEQQTFSALFALLIAVGLFLFALIMNIA